MSAVPARRLAGLALLALAGLAAAGCGSGDPTSPRAPGFLGGTASSAEIGLVVNSTGRALTMFQLGSPTTTRQIALGTSSLVTPVGLSVRGRRAAVPLGEAASVALVDLEAAAVARYFTFASGNATGSAFVDDTTVIAANTGRDRVGRFTTGQAGDAITQTAAVAPDPTAVVVAGGRAFVVSSNLDPDYAAIGPGVVTALDPRTLQVLGTVSTGDYNSTDAAVGPDGLLYVVNTGDYVTPGSVTVIDPAALTLVTRIGNMGIGPGAISIDAQGLAYVSGLSGTFVFDTRARAFVRGEGNPVCARLPDQTCRGSFGATTNAAGDLYQAFFGSASQAPYVFVYRAGSLALRDSIAVGTGPAAIAVRTF